MADISGLNLLAPDPVDFSSYQEGGEFQAPPPEGTYYVQVPDKITFSATKEGQLQAIIDPLLLTDANSIGKGYRIGFTRVSTKKYKNRNGSPAGDYLRSFGIEPKGTLTAQEYANLIESTAGRVCPIQLEWEAYDKETDFTLKGEDNFPKREDGSRSYKGVCPHNKKEIYARGRVRRFVSSLVTA